MNAAKKLAHGSLGVLFLVLILSIGFLAGCAEIAAARAAVAQHGADGADQALDAAIWAMCNGSPVGAVVRRFDTEPERAAYTIICGHEPPVYTAARFDR